MLIGDAYARTDCFRLFTNTGYIYLRTPSSFAGTHLPLELDVTSNESIKGVIEEAINKYKRPPSIVVNCAGITRDAFILKMDDSDFDLVLNVNFKVRLAIAKKNIDSANSRSVASFREHIWS